MRLIKKAALFSYVRLFYALGLLVKYGFTPKEIETFEKLVTTEMGVQEIADEMGISRRVLQRHISSIYEKTETKTRIGLYILLNR